MRFPLNTRPGYERLPMDPPWRKYSCVPWLAGKPLKWCRLMTPAVPRPLLTPLTCTSWPGAKTSDDADLRADGRRAIVALRQRELAQHPECARAGLRELAAQCLRQALGLQRPEADLGGGVAVALGAAHPDDGARSRLDDRHRDEDALRRVHLGHPQLAADEARDRRAHGLLQLDLDVDARGEIELAERIDGLLGRLQDVEQPLVGANLELLA